MMSAPAPIEALLFDLGGVVIEIDVTRSLDHWARLSTLTADQMRERIAADEPFRQHECGILDGPGYFAHLRRLLELDGDDTAVGAGWNALLVDQIDSTLDLIESVREQLPCYAFSNTSATHRLEWSSRFPRVVHAFERLFLSYEMGLRKPDHAAFRYVTEQIGRAPETILFFDDMAENVEAARAFGLRAVQVTAPADVRKAIEDLDLQLA